MTAAILCGNSFAQRPDTNPARVEPDTQQGTFLCPNNGSCCTGHGGPGCDNTSCCNTVCNIDSFCCDFGWDDKCAGLAETFCGSTCAGSCPGEGDCCAAHPSGGCSNELCCDQVCNSMPSCCEAVWSTTCANLAGQICDACKPPTQCPQPGDCCVGRSFTAGCERKACCEKVCDLDEFCCIGEWDDVCAGKANLHCHNVCDCESFGDLDAGGEIDLRDAMFIQRCFSGEGSPPVAEECACADYDADGDSDLQDFAVFTDLLNGPRR